MHALVHALCGPGLSVLQTAAVSTALLAAYALAMSLAVELHASAPGYQRTAPPPKLSRATMLAHGVAGWAGYALPTSLWDAWARPAWSTSAPGLLATSYWCLFFLAIVDGWYFCYHRFVHNNRTAYRLLHATHHEPTASMHATTAGYVNPLSAALEVGAPMALATALTACVTGNLWHALAGVSAFVALNCYGHTAIDLALDSPLDWGAVILCPLLLPYVIQPLRQAPHDHLQHHTNPRSNFAPHFTWLDAYFQTQPAGDKRLPCSLLVMGMMLAHHAAVMVTLQLLISWPAHALAAYVVAYLLVPVELAAAVTGGLCVPELVRSCCGRLQDAARRDLAVTYSSPGSLGAFTPVESSANVSTKPATYIFACHPTGVLSRGALMTFAARGWGSPVSGLARVRLAVGNVLFQLPVIFSRELLLAIGCVPAGKDSLRRQLAAGTSIAITPGGFREPTHTGSYKVLLRERRGFIALALETGAHLVPTLSLGEHTLGTDWGQKPYERPYATYAAWARRVVGAIRPEPIHVVFGSPLTPKDGEGVDQLHARYTASLLSLAADHGVKLELL